MSFDVYQENTDDEGFDSDFDSDENLL